MNTPADMPQDVITVEETAEVLGLTPQETLRRLQQRQLPGFEIGGHWRSIGWALREWMEATGYERPDR